MKKGRKLLCALGTGALFSVFWTLRGAIAQANLPDTCTLGDLLYAIRIGGWGHALLAFAIVAYLVDALLRPVGNMRGGSSITFETSGPSTTEWNTNGSMMGSCGFDATGHGRGDTRLL